MIHVGDCVEVMAGMDADSVDAIVTEAHRYYGVEGWDACWHECPDAHPDGCGLSIAAHDDGTQGP